MKVRFFFSGNGKRPAENPGLIFTPDIFAFNVFKIDIFKIKIFIFNVFTI